MQTMKSIIMPLLKAAFFSFLMLGSVLSFSQVVSTLLKGDITGRESRSLILVTDSQDPRFEGVEIPIVNNKFEYHLQAPVIQKFRLVFADELQDGSYWPVEFFPDLPVIEFVLHDHENFLNNTIAAGKLNVEMFEFEHAISEVFAPLYEDVEKEIEESILAEEYYSSRIYELFKEIEQTEDELELFLLYREQSQLLNTAEGFSRKGNNLNKKLESISGKYFAWQLDYIAENPGIVSYSMLYSQVEDYGQLKEHMDLEKIKRTYKQYQEQFPRHPYTIMIGNRLNGMEKIVPGGSYIDFAALNLQGETIRISQVKEGELLLLDFWASWCGTCRDNSKNIIPLYQKYGEHGLQVIGVAREYNNIRALRMAIALDGYPWVNLVEIDNMNMLWLRYNITGAGAQILIDSEGTILAVNPDLQTLEEILSHRLRVK